MILRYWQEKRRLTVLLMVFMLLGLVTACQAPSAEEAGLSPSALLAYNKTNVCSGVSHDEDTNGTAIADGASNSQDEMFVPNNGAAVHIATPADGSTFKSSKSVLVTIETTNFTIGENGNHWHIYLDGSPIMVMGGNTFVLQNLAAGEHDIEVYLSNGRHENLEQGDKVSITVEE
ncbi:MAG: hypothetical protein P8183_06165 [Anaerolineae bacterium]